MKTRAIESSLHRFLAAAMALAMLLTLWTAPASASSDWSSMQITLNWIDENGSPAGVQAMPGSGWSGQSFWATLPTIPSYVTLGLSHPMHGDYQFNPAYGSSVDVSAAAYGTPVVQEIQAYDGSGNLADTYTLYISTSAMPAEDPANPMPAGQPAYISVLHRDTVGNVFSSYQDVLNPNESRTYSAEIPSGYQLYAGYPSSVTVSVDAYGNASQTSVEFVYEQVAQNATISVLHRTTDGTVLNSYQDTIPGNESRTYRVDSYDGYQPYAGWPTEVTVSVDAYGNASQTSVEFVYEPVVYNATISVLHRTTDGTVLNSYQDTIPGNESRTYRVDSYDGYQPYAGWPTEVTVSVDAYGNASQTSVEFVYEPIVYNATISVLHRTTDGTQLNSYQDTIPGGESKTYTAETYEGYQPYAGYPTEITVSVDAYGNASQTSVEFVYEPVVYNATISVLHRTTDGTQLNSYQDTISGGESKTYTAETYEGYQPYAGWPTEVTVSVDAYGNASQTSVEFVYEPVVYNATISVLHRTTDGTVLNSYQDTISGGESKTYTVETYEGYQPYAGYPTEVTVSVDAYGNASQTSVEFVYEPVVYNATISVLHRTTDGTVLNSYQDTISGGESKTYTAEAFEGYQPYEGYPTEVTVTVDGKGNASQASVEFVYEPAPQAATITVLHRSTAGEELKSYTDAIEPKGSKTYTVEAFEGYQPYEGYPTEVTVTVDGKGNASQASVEFVYEPAPQAATITVLHRNTAGEELKSYTDAIEPNGSKTYTVEAFEGYQPYEGYPTEVTVTVDGKGNASQTSVEFVYEPAPQAATITVLHRNTAGEELRSYSDVIEPNGSKTYAVEAFEGYQPYEGYPTEVTVTVDGKGNASQASVEFVYEPAPQAATITVLHRNTAGEELRSYSDAIEPNGSKVYTVESFEGYQPYEGYPTEVTVTVDGKGNASQASVEFVYEPAPQAATITVLHRNTAGDELKSYTDAIAPNGSKVYTVESFEGYQPYEGYPTEVTVTVDAKGNASQTNVEFVYASIPQPATIKIVHRKTNGETLKTSTDQLGANESRTYHAEGFEGYSLSAGYPNEVTVSVDGKGKASADTVEFVYEQVSYSATVTILHRNTVGDTLSTYQDVIGANQSRRYTANSFSGYQLYQGFASTVTVTVDGKGRPSQDLVEFVYEPVQITGTVYVVHCLENGTILKATNEPIKAGETIKLFAEVPQGYQVSSESATMVQVYMDPSGKLSQDSVTFIYVPLQVLNGTLTIRYVNVAGANLIAPYTVTIPGNTTQTIRPDAARLPVGYDIDSAAAQTVTASIDGIVTPSVITFTFKRLSDAEETPIPAGSVIDRWAQTNTRGVNVRREPNGQSLVQIANQGTPVWAVRSEIRSGTSWTMVIYNGQTGWIRSDLLTIKTSSESADIQDSLRTPVPTTVPMVTTPPVITITPVPNITANPSQYTGYALTRQSTQLYYEANSRSRAMATVNGNTLVSVRSQVSDLTGSRWDYVRTLDGAEGYLLDSTTMHITDAQAQPYIDAYNRAHATPTVTPVSTSVAQISGYAYTIGDNVPFRATYSDRSVIYSLLSRDTPVYVSGQIYDTADGWPWHSVLYNGEWGYIRTDMLRMMSAEETSRYISGATATPAVNVTAAPYNPASPSSYGYIYASNNGRVNVRSQPSTGATSLTRLRQYAFCLILGTQNINGTTWYHIDYNGTRGYVSGNFFHQMSMAELENFLNSDEYLQGIRNNSPQNNPAPTQANVVSPEQQNAHDWSSPDNDDNVSYATWAPIATTPPLATPTRPPLATPTPSPTAGAAAGTDEGESTNTFRPFGTPTPSDIPIGTIEPETTGGGSGTLILILLLVLLLLAGGGVAFYVVHRNNKRAAAQRAAARKAQAARGAANPSARPGAKPAGAAPEPRTGAYANRPAPTQQAGTQQPGGGMYTNAYRGTAPTAGQNNAAYRGTAPTAGQNNAAYRGTAPTAGQTNTAYQRPAAPQQSGTPASQADPNAARYQTGQPANQQATPANGQQRVGGRMARRQNAEGSQPGNQQ